MNHIGTFMDIVSTTERFGGLSTNIGRSNARLTNSIAKLSSGNRLVEAKMDVAGMSIATSLNTRIISLRSSLVNISQASSMLQVSDNALSNVDDMLQRMSTLSVMANSGTLTNTERGFLNLEFQQLRKEVDTTLQGANFNGVALFGGTDALPTKPKEVVDNTVRSLGDIIGRETGEVHIDTGSEQFSAYVDNDGTDSWLLVGRGREDWEFDADGQGNRDDVIKGLGTSAAFDPAAYDPSIINDLIAQSGLNLTDVEIRLRRASNVAGTEYQDVLWRPTAQSQWTWDFDGANLNVEQDVRPSSLGGFYSDPTARTRDSGFGTPGFSAGNNQNRVWTFAWGGKNGVQGFNYGSPISGVNNNDPDTFLWERTGENHATPYTEVYIRLKNPPVPVEEAPELTGLESIDGLQFWLDGADLDGDGISEGASESGISGGVTQWVDKAGNANATLGAGSSINSPTYITNALNNNSVVRFDGVNDYLAAEINTPETNYTQFVVFNTTDNSGAFTTATNGPSNTANAHDRQFGLRGNGRIVNRLWSNQTIGTNSSQTFNDNVGHIASITVDSTAGQHIDVDGVEVASGNKTSSNFTWQTHMVIGGHNLYGRYGGDIAEIINFDRVLNDSEMEAVEGYLAHKWGTTNLLPGSHTYKDIAPFAQNPDDISLSVKEDISTESVLVNINAGYPEGTLFSITEGNDSELFTISSANGEISLAPKQMLDYETAQLHELSVTITLPDDSGVLTQKVTINVENINETTVSFVVGEDVNNVVEVPVGLLNTNILFDETSLNIITQSNAEEAFNAIQNAIDTVTSRRAEIGALQSRTDYLSEVRQSDIRNQNAARSAITDTDIAQESTIYSLTQVQATMSINALSETTRLSRTVILDIMQNGFQIDALV